MPLSGRACATLSQALIVSLLCLLLGACSGGPPAGQPSLSGTQAASPPPAEAEPPAGLSLELPSIATLPREALSLSDPVVRTVSERLPGAPFENRVSMDADTGVFTPAFMEGVSPFSGLAWCILPISGLAGYSGPELLYLGWEGDAPDNSRVYIALADYSGERWRLMQGPAEGEQLDLGQISHMLSPEGVLYVAVIISGLSEVRLQYMLFGGALVAGQTQAAPDLGTGSLQTSITVDYDILGGVVESFDLDIEGDGSFEFLDDADGQWDVNYPQPGKYSPTARINVSNGPSVLAGAGTVHVINPDNQPPVALLSPEFASGDAPLQVSFNAGQSSDSDGGIELYEWDFDGNGSYDLSTTGPQVNFNYGMQGNFSARLRITDTDLATAEATTEISVSAGWSSIVLDPDSDNEALDAGSSGPLFAPRPLVVYQVHLPGVSELRAVRSSDTQGENWGSIEKLDNSEQTGQLPQVISHDFRPAVAYSRGTQVSERELFFQRAAEGGGWESPVLVSATKGGRVSMNLVDGLPCIASSSGDNKINIFQPDDDSLQSWSLSDSVDSALPGSAANLVSLSLFSSGSLPHVLFRRPGLGELMRSSALTAQGSEWSEPELCFMSDMVMFAQRTIGNRPAVAFVANGQNELYYCRSLDEAATEWPQPLLVDDGISKSHNCGIAVVNGMPALAYLDSERNYIVCSFASDAEGQSWQPPMYVAATGQTFGIGLDFIVGIGGRPLIFHHRRAQGSDYELVLSAPAP